LTTYSCDSGFISGGPGTYNHSFTFDETISILNITFISYFIEDKLIVSDTIDSKLRILFNGSFISGTNMFSVNIPDDNLNSVTIKIIAPKISTLWEYKVDCVPGTRGPIDETGCIVKLKVQSRICPGDEIKDPPSIITSNNSKINCPSICLIRVYIGTSVNLEAKLKIGTLEFDHWEGPYLSVLDNTCVVIVDVNKTIIACYVRIVCLTVSVVPSNAGTISNSSGLISYPASPKKCSPSGTVFHLITSPNSGYKFDHWGGTYDSTSGLTCIVTLKTIDIYTIAYYTIAPIIPPGQFCLTVKTMAAPAGNIKVYTIASPTTPVIDYPTNPHTHCSKVTIAYYLTTKSLDPAKYTFHHWSTNVTLIPSAPQTCNITISTNTTVIAYYIGPFCLEVETDPAFAGDVKVYAMFSPTPSIPVIEYPTKPYTHCSLVPIAYYLTTNSLDLAKYTFHHWSTNVTLIPSAPQTAGITISSDTTVIAYYVKQFCLTVRTSPADAGEIKVYAMFSPTPSIPVIEYPTSDKHCSSVPIAYYLTTNALDPKYTFNHWSPNVTLIPASPQTAGITISSDTLVIAYYTSFCLIVETSPPKAGYIDVYTTSSPTPSIPVIAYPKTIMDCKATTYYLTTHSINTLRYTFLNWSTNVIPKPVDLQTADITITKDTLVIAYYEEHLYFTVETNPSSVARITNWVPSYDPLYVDYPDPTKSIDKIYARKGTRIALQTVEMCPSYVFSKWSTNVTNDLSIPGVHACEFFLNAITHVVAYYIEPNVIIVKTCAAGVATITCNTLNINYPYNDRYYGNEDRNTPHILTIDNTQKAHFYFKGWTGLNSAHGDRVLTYNPHDQSTCQVYLVGKKTIIAEMSIAFKHYLGYGTFCIQTEVNPPCSGVITGGPFNETVTRIYYTSYEIYYLNAIPKPGYKFIRWVCKNLGNRNSAKITPNGSSVELRPTPPFGAMMYSTTDIYACGWYAAEVETILVAYFGPTL
jgi:hypothetical protein